MSQTSSEQSQEPSHDEDTRTDQVITQKPTKKDWYKNPLLTALGGFLLAVIPGIISVLVSPWLIEHWDPPSKSVSLGAVCLESGVTRGSFYLGYGEKNVRDSTLEGLLVSVALTASGFDGEYIYMNSDVLNASSGAEALGSRVSLGNLRPIPANASTVMRDPRIWVPLPANPGQYVVQIRVADGDLLSGNEGLASAYSRVFTLDSSGRVTLPGLCTAG